MAPYIVKRVIGALVVLVLMSFVAFMLINIVPGNTLLAQIARSGAVTPGGVLDPEVLAEFERELGLDKPVLERYADWISQALQGDLGTSFFGPSVIGIVRERLPISIELLLIASVISFVLGVPLGVLSAVRQGGAWDYVTRTMAILGIAVPSFFLGIVILLIFSGWFDISLSTLEKPLLWEDPIQNLHAPMMRFVHS